MTHLAFGGASTDGGPYTRVAYLAQHAPHTLNTLLSYGTDHGPALFAALMLIGWRRARSGASGAMAPATPLARRAAPAVDRIRATRLRPLVAAR
ncbi:hypothetical protein SAMN05428945_0251 [Streptomyces sp. 2224.1]|uniref:hypothetical protein n=1 Tax=unclassified Streptomyces TaxID=2593676 RepID=UPI00087F9593|nr:MULTISPECIES: hypothetical protein [unclassified Streptomyces]PBC85177.1 hypothetical protein BX261_5178 [Streptomyces sp. 2321.6]SDR20699.1 undecaprenyl-diphosphatase [Streptomyces sp. KS_16]SEB52615.1 hypothetical protein SAMN05428945_0251 [Streptomyces sp. 2224.1]SED58583.1 hypothetical protein SAMN05428940_5204 [Streptomyces sp. 2133.1]SEE25596.1 undecaprenyl-diphosphatase [Streptomyces sp. 2112.3]